MHYVWMVIIGLIVGVIAKFVHPGKDNMLIALEIARQMQDCGQPVSFVGLADSQVPDAGRFDYALRDVAFLEDGGIETSRDHILYPLLSEMGIAVTSSAARMNHIIRIIKTLRRLEGAHRPVMPAGPVHLLVAADASAIVGGDRLCNEWRSLANGSLKVYSVPGDHYTLLRDGNAATFARVLKHIFNSAQ